jgi:predicted DNA-binding transcriptional regulator AlpA
MSEATRLSTRRRVETMVGEDSPDTLATRVNKRANAALNGAPLPSALSAFDQLPDSAYVRLPVVMALFSRSASSIWRDVKAKRLPAPRSMGPRCSAWNVGQIRAVLRGEGV